MKQEVMRGIRMAEETLVAQNFDKEISQQLADTVEAVQAVEASTNAIVVSLLNSCLISCC